MRAVITVIGKDTVGIIYHVSKVLFESNTNILDISQTVMQEMFTMITLVDMSKSELGFEDLSMLMKNLEKELGLSIHVQHEDIFNSMHRI